MATLFRQPVITRIWRSDPAGVAIRSQANVWTNVLPLELLSRGTILRMPITTRIWHRDPWGVAIRAQPDVWQNQITANLLDIHRTYDYPNPRGYQYPVSLRGWIWQGNIQLPFIVGNPALAYASDLAAVVCTASDSPSGQGWSGEGYMTKYEIDTSVQIRCEFRDPLNGIYVDPTEVQLFIMDPAGVIVDYTSIDGSVLRSEAGHYYHTMVLDESGTWTYKWQGTGAYVATSPDQTMTVNPSALIGG